MTGAIRSLLRKLAGHDNDTAPAVLELPDGRVYVLLAPRGEAPLDLSSVKGPNLHLESDSGRAYRSSVALELMDADVYGFMLLMLKGGEEPEVAFRAQSDPAWADAFSATLAQVALAL